MKLLRLILPLIVLVSLLTLPLSGQDKKPSVGKPKPIRALLITGGCCHDYDTQKQILMAGIGERTPIKWEFVYEQFEARDHKIALYNNPDWAMGYDVVVHNECYGGVTDDAFVNRITEGHLRAKAAAVFLHCSMHSYRAASTDEYRKLIGVSSFNHGKKSPITLKKLAKHPVIDPLPDGYVTPNGELYNTNPKTHPDAKVWESATALAEGKIPTTEEPQVCIWINEYQGLRTFSTTLGHHNETMADSVYLDLVTRGLLWTLGNWTIEPGCRFLYSPNMTFRLVVEFDPKASRWSAFFPEIPGCTSAGDTEEEAVSNAREALELWFEPIDLEIPENARVMEVALP